jgi:two-component system, chemotaxis family, response regulator Rcp1
VEAERKFDILLVEDNPADAGLFDALFTQACRRCVFHLATDGEEATDFLFRRGRWKDAPRPRLIVLDINLPKIDGKEVLQEIKSDHSLRTIPVLVLTSSESETDINLSYEYGANCVLIKPSDVDGVSRLFNAMEEFWVNQVRYPA